MNSSASYDLNNLIPKLLDQLIMIGEAARRIKYTMNGNGMYPSSLANIANELIEE